MRPSRRSPPARACRSATTSPWWSTTTSARVAAWSSSLLPDGVELLDVLERHGTVPAAALHHRRRLADPSATRPPTPSGPARSPPRPPGSTSRPRSSTRSGPRAPRSRRWSWSWASAPSARSPTDRVEDHHMHGERYTVPEATMEACRSRRRGSWPWARPRSGRSSRPRPPASSSGRTELFIHGDRPFALVGALLTNFHQPRSSLLVLVEAFVGPRWRVALRRGPRPAATGSSASATPCSCGVSADDPVDGGHRHRPAWRGPG